MPTDEPPSLQGGSSLFAGITQPLEEQQDHQRDGKRHDDRKCQQQLRERAHGIPPQSPRKDSEGTARSLIEL